MGGAAQQTVKSVAKVAATIASPVVQTAQIGISALKGEGASKALAAPARSIVQNSKEAVASAPGTLVETGLAEAPKAPASILADDPAAVAEDAKKRKEAARRQAEIDILTDRPGRGGTILTDNYNYKT